jgi:hypothetical protein
MPSWQDRRSDAEGDPSSEYANVGSPGTAISAHGTFETCRDVRSLVAIRERAELTGHRQTDAIDPSPTPVP